MSATDWIGRVPGAPEQGGEPACMLPLLCRSCGRVPDNPGDRVCPACGADLAAEPPPPAVPDPAGASG